jgi:hypothetical protein
MPPNKNNTSAMNILVVSPPTFGKHPGAAAKETFANVELLHNMGHEVSCGDLGEFFTSGFRAL